MNNEPRRLHRFPRLDVSPALKGIPRFDPANVKTNTMLIEDFIIEGSTHVSYGSFGTRKTSIHLLAGWCISQGIEFMGRKSKRRMVLYLDYENPQGVLRAYCEDLKLDPTDPWFTLWDRRDTPPPQPSESEDDPIEKYIRRCKKVTGHGPHIVFDSFTSLLRAGESGNDLNHAAPIYRNVRRYCDMGATCVIIDHTGKKKGKEAIGSSAKMTQMDAAHYFSAQSHALGLNARSSHTIIRVEGFLKRYAPKDVGTFSIEVKAALNDKGVWHTTSVAPTKDIAELKLEQQIETLKGLIRKHGSRGQEEVVAKAMELPKGQKIPRADARRLLQEGIGTYWETRRAGTKRLIFRVIGDK